MAKLAKLNMDAVRQNPGGQCCVDNVTAPLSEAATWGTALSALAARPDLTPFQTKLRGFWGMYAGAQIELAKLPNMTAIAARDRAETHVRSTTGAAATAKPVSPIVSQRTHAVGVGGGPDKPPAPAPIKLVRLTYGLDLLASAYSTVA